MPSAILLMLLVKLKQVLFHSLNRNIHIRSDALLRACPKNDRFAKKISLGSTAILLLFLFTAYGKRFNKAGAATFIPQGLNMPVYPFAVLCIKLCALTVQFFTNQPSGILFGGRSFSI